MEELRSVKDNVDTNVKKFLRVFGLENSIFSFSQSYPPSLTSLIFFFFFSHHN